MNDKEEEKATFGLCFITVCAAILVGRIILGG